MHPPLSGSPAPPPGRYRSEGAPRGVGNSRLKAKIGTFVDLAAMLIGVAMGRGAVRELLDRDRSSVPAQELAAEQIGGATEAARPGFRTVSRPDKGFSIDLPETMDGLPMTVQTLDENVALLESLNPTLASALKGNTALLDQVRLFAIDRETGTTQVIQRVRAGRGADIADVPRGTFSGEYRKYGAASADEAMVRASCRQGPACVRPAPPGPVDGVGHPVRAGPRRVRVDPDDLQRQQRQGRRRHRGHLPLRVVRRRVWRAG